MADNKDHKDEKDVDAAATEDETVVAEEAAVDATDDDASEDESNAADGEGDDESEEKADEEEADEPEASDEEEADEEEASDEEEADEADEPEASNEEEADDEEAPDEEEEGEADEPEASDEEEADEAGEPEASDEEEASDKEEADEAGEPEASDEEEADEGEEEEGEADEPAASDDVAAAAKDSDSDEEEPEVVVAGDDGSAVVPAIEDESAGPGSIRGVAAFFDFPDDLMLAAAHTRDSKWNDFEAYSPFPIHGMDDAMGIGRSWMPWVTFGAGAAGLTTAISLQFGTMTFDWPMIIGGKPYAPWPSFVPVMFELTVLFAGCITALVMLIAAGCFKRPLIIDPELTQDRFALWISAEDEAFDLDEVKAFMSGLEPVEIRTITAEA
jgi:hypothetical protein